MKKRVKAQVPVPSVRVKRKREERILILIRDAINDGKACMAVSIEKVYGSHDAYVKAQQFIREGQADYVIGCSRVVTLEQIQEKSVSEQMLAEWLGEDITNTWVFKKPYRC